MFHGAAQRMAETIVQNAPAGWTRAVVSITHSPGFGEQSGGYTVPGRSMAERVRGDWAGADHAIAKAARDLRGWAGTTIGIECTPCGEYRLAAYSDAITDLRNRGVGDRGYLAVLDDGYRLPEPGLRQEEGTAPPAGDPEAAVGLFRTYMDERAAILGRRERLPSPATSAALDEAERRIGRALPADLRALYAIADGDGTKDGHRHVFGDLWYPLEDAIALMEPLSEPYWFGWELDRDSVVFDADPPGAVRRCSGHPAWFPLGDGEDGNHLAVDLSPGPNGRPGQVIRFGRDYTEGPVRVADSVTSLIRHCLTAVREGRYDTTDRGLHIGREDPVQPRLDGYLEDLADPPTTLQAIRINDARGPVDLSPLAKAPHLRLLHLNRCAAADLSPVGALPVESLRVDLDRGDLTPLEGHRQIVSLEASSSAPIGIAPLRTAENLRALDLSRAVVGDLTVLADLEGLRYLSLNAGQWAAVFANGAVPPALAAARLAAEDAAFEDALAWAGHLGLDTGNALRASGSLGGGSG